MTNYTVVFGAAHGAGGDVEVQSYVGSDLPVLPGMPPLPPQPAPTPLPLPPCVQSITVVPMTAPVGTMRTVTINATDPQGLPLTYTLIASGKAIPPTGAGNVFQVRI